MGRGPNLIEVLFEDHASIHDLFWRLRRGDEADRGVLFDELSGVYVRHEVAEEAVVYEFLLTLPGGSEVAAERMSEQRRSEQELVDLGRLDPASAAFAAQIARLETTFMAHAAKEEAEVFPMIELNATIAVLERLGARYEASRRSSSSVPPDAESTGRPRTDRATSIASMIKRVREAVRAS
jgi:hypothetical protein